MGLLVARTSVLVAGHPAVSPERERHYAEGLALCSGEGMHPPIDPPSARVI